MVKAKRVLAWVMQYLLVLQRVGIGLALVTALFWMFGIDSISKPLALVTLGVNLFVLGLGVLDHWLIRREQEIAS